MRSCTDLCWKLSGRAHPAVLPPSSPSLCGVHCAGASSGQHLDTGQQGERLRAAGSDSAGICPHRPNDIPPHPPLTLGQQTPTVNNADQEKKKKKQKSSTVSYEDGIRTSLILPKMFEMSKQRPNHYLLLNAK